MLPRSVAVPVTIGDQNLTQEETNTLPALAFGDERFILHASQGVMDNNCRNHQDSANEYDIRCKH